MRLVCDEAGALIVVKMDQLREYLADPVQYSKKMSVSKRIYTKAQKKFQENMKEMKFSLRKLFFFFFMKIKFHGDSKNHPRADLIVPPGLVVSSRVSRCVPRG